MVAVNDGLVQLAFRTGVIDMQIGDVEGTGLLLDVTSMTLKLHSNASRGNKPPKSHNSQSERNSRTAGRHREAVCDCGEPVERAGDARAAGRSVGRAASAWRPGGS